MPIEKKLENIFSDFFMSIEKTIGTDSFMSIEKNWKTYFRFLHVNRKNILKTFFQLSSCQSKKKLETFFSEFLCQSKKKENFLFRFIFVYRIFLSLKHAMPIKINESTNHGKRGVVHITS